MSQTIRRWRDDPGENRLSVALAIIAAIALQLLLPNRYGLRPRPALPALEMVLLVVVVALNPLRLSRPSVVARSAGIALVAVISLDNVVSAVLLDRAIVTGQTGTDAPRLLAGAAAIYLTNVVAFGVWFWELDRGGPFARAAGAQRPGDFLFPQMANRDIAPAGWEPRFFDYLYVSLTNALAFSPTDTMPLSRWAKALMSLQSLVALSTTALVVARAVNILK